jgi:Zn-dependent peptidase ImmA (M78 family)
MDHPTKEDVIQRAIGIFHSEQNIDMVKLAQTMDIDVYAKEDDDAFNSEISYDKTTDKYFIIVNANHPLVRQRFSIAHEIGHYVLHFDILKKHGYISREDVIIDIDKKREDEADAFAAEVLMPEQLVEEYRTENKIEHGQKITESVINSIADYFKVSRIVALLRMRHLGYYVPYIAFS